MSQRRTSAAKDILEQQADSALERYGQLTDGFQQSQNAQQPLEAFQDQAQGQSDPHARTSAARDILDQQADEALERYGQTSQSFNAAHDNQQDQGTGQGRGSSMVANDQPTHDLRPDPELAASSDRTSFNDRWNQEQQDAQPEQKNDSQDFGR